MDCQHVYMHPCQQTCYANDHHQFLTLNGTIANILFTVPHQGGGWGARRTFHRPAMINGHPVDREPHDSTDNHRILTAIRAHNAHALASCHAPRTLRSYNAGWNSWRRCTSRFGIDPFCQQQSVDQITQSIKIYIGYECGCRGITPKSVKEVYIIGIADYLDRVEVPSHFREAANHPSLKCIWSGYIRGHSEKHPACARVKIPFDVTMALSTEGYLDSGAIRVAHMDTTHPTSIDKERLMAAMFLGIFFLLRKGEFLPHEQQSNHVPFLRSHVRLYDSNGSVIPHGNIGTTVAQTVSISIVFSKADQTGRGRILHHERSTQQPRHCVVQRLEAYLAKSRVQHGSLEHDRLFDIPGRAQLTSQRLALVMKDTCRLLGLPPALISAHSLRYGGATMLASAGFPEYIIAFYGGWAPGSRAMRRYIQISPTSISMVSHHMAAVASSTSVQQVVQETLRNRIPASMRTTPGTCERSHTTRGNLPREGPSGGSGKR